MSDEQPANRENHIDPVGDKVDMVAAKLDQLISGPVQALLEGQSRLEGKVESLGKGQAGLATQMRVLHEAAKDEIKLVAERVGALDKKLEQGFKDVRAAIAHHSTVLDDHEQRLGAIEKQ